MPETIKMAGTEYITGTTALGKALKMSRAAAWKRIETGSVKAVKMGSQYFIPMYEVRRVRRILNIKPL